MVEWTDGYYFFRTQAGFGLALPHRQARVHAHVSCPPPTPDTSPISLIACSWRFLSGPSNQSLSVSVFLCLWQYGFVNHALELLVIRNYGPEVWEDIK